VSVIGKKSTKIERGNYQERIREGEGLTHSDCGLHRKHVRARVVRRKRASGNIVTREGGSIESVRTWEIVETNEQGAHLLLQERTDR
jgi:hypothetical protein